MYLIRRLGDARLIGKIVEVEAYLGSRDPASHAYRGRTPRNEVMFRNGGHLYVYFTYGMHFCSNVVTEKEGRGMAVLLRAIEPVSGVAQMAGHRGCEPEDLLNLCSGPARLCKALAIGRDQNGTDLCGDEIWIARSTDGSERPALGRSPRVGVSEGKESPWRFFLRDSPFVSKGKPSRK
jgi:DNA-3-methyladenine glycosylase